MVVSIHRAYGTIMSFEGQFMLWCGLFYSYEYV